MSEFESLIRSLELTDEQKSDIIAAYVAGVNAASSERGALIERKNADISELNARIAELELELAEIKRDGARNLSFEPPRLEVLNFG